MAIITIDVSEEQKDFVDAQVAAGHYESASALVQRLLDRAKWRVDVEESLEEGLRELENGEFTVWKKGDSMKQLEELRRQRTNVS